MLSDDHRTIPGNFDYIYYSFSKQRCWFKIKFKYFYKLPHEVQLSKELKYIRVLKMMWRCEWKWQCVCRMPSSTHLSSPTHTPSYKFQWQAKYTFAILFSNLETMQRSSKTSQTSKAKREPMISASQQLSIHSRTIKQKHQLRMGQRAQWD